MKKSKKTKVYYGESVLGHFYGKDEGVVKAKAYEKYDWFLKKLNIGVDDLKI